MQVTITVPDEVVARARGEGMSVETYIEGVVANLSPKTELEAAKLNARRRPSPGEIRAWLDELAQFSDEIPPMPNETFSREMIYENHD